jgi:hypothetical protein
MGEGIGLPWRELDLSQIKTSTTHREDHWQSGERSMTQYQKICQEVAELEK